MRDIKNFHLRPLAWMCGHFGASWKQKSGEIKAKFRSKFDQTLILSYLEVFTIGIEYFLLPKLLRNVISFHLRSLTLFWGHFEGLHGQKSDQERV